MATKTKKMSDWSKSHFQRLGLNFKEVEIRYLNVPKLTWTRYMLEADKDSITLFLPIKAKSFSVNEQLCFLESTFLMIAESNLCKKPKLSLVPGSKGKKTAN